MRRPRTAPTELLTEDYPNRSYKQLVMLSPYYATTAEPSLASSFITDGHWYKALLHVFVWLSACACQWICWNEMRRADNTTEPQRNLIFFSALCTSFAILVIVGFGSFFSSLPQWPIANALLFSFACAPLGALIATITTAMSTGGLVYSLAISSFLLQLLGDAMILAFYIAMITRFDGGTDLRAVENPWRHRMRAELSKQGKAEEDGYKPLSNNATLQEDPMFV